jgi:hypothetical protein
VHETLRNVRNIHIKVLASICSDIGPSTNIVHVYFLLNIVYILLNIVNIDILLKYPKWFYTQLVNVYILLYTP